MTLFLITTFHHAPSLYITLTLVLIANLREAAGSILATPTVQPQASGTVGVPIGGGYIFTTGVPGCTSTSTTGGSFTYTWGTGTSGNSICGKGWTTGTNRYVPSIAKTLDYTFCLTMFAGPFRTIGYSGTYNPIGNSYLAVYGWTRNPLVEYYVVENFGTYNPSSAAQKKGTVTCSGRTYDVLQTTRYNQPSIDGTQTFQQLWSVAQDAQRNGTVKGVVDMGCHFKAWEALSVTKLGTHNYQLLVVEAYFSSGTATITIANYTVPW